MNQEILYKQDSGIIGIICPAEGFLNFFIEKLKMQNAEYLIVNDIDIDNNFFDAYEFDRKLGAKINTTKAKEIWLEHYRRARTPLLSALDVDFMRAVESGNATLQKEIASKKQALRDVTKTDLPNTLEEIKATWPEILGQNPFK